MNPRNIPRLGNAVRQARLEKPWAVRRALEIGIGVLSSSGKSAEKYRVMDEVTASPLAIKTPGRSTHKMDLAPATRVAQTRAHLKVTASPSAFQTEIGTSIEVALLKKQPLSH